MISMVKKTTIGLIHSELAEEMNQGTWQEQDLINRLNDILDQLKPLRGSKIATTSYLDSCLLGLSERQIDILRYILFIELRDDLSYCHTLNYHIKRTWEQSSIAPPYKEIPEWLEIRLQLDELKSFEKKREYLHSQKIVYRGNSNIMNYINDELELVNNQEAQEREEVDENDILTTPQKAIIIYFLLKELHSDCPNTEMARFAHALTGRGYQALLDCFKNIISSRKEKNLRREDLKVAREWFQKLGLQKLTEEINRQLKD